MKLDIRRMREIIAKRGDCAGPVTTFPPQNGHSSPIVGIFAEDWVACIEWLAMCEQELPCLLDDYDRLSAEVERLLTVAYAASYYVNSQKGITQLYDAVRDREHQTDFSNYRTREVRIEQQSHRIGNLEADKKELREQLAAALKAKNEACDWLAERLGPMQPANALDRLAELRSIGTTNKERE